MELSKEFLEGEPLVPQEKVGELVQLRLVHPWGDKHMWQVRWLYHGQELCISPTVYERDFAILSAKEWLREKAAFILSLVDRF